MEPPIASPTITPVPNAVPVSADKTRTMTTPSRQENNNPQIASSSSTDRHEIANLTLQARGSPIVTSKISPRRCWHGQRALPASASRRLDGSPIATRPGGGRTRRGRRGEVMVPPGKEGEREGEGGWKGEIGGGPPGAGRRLHSGCHIYGGAPFLSLCVALRREDVVGVVVGAPLLHSPCGRGRWGVGWGVL